MGKTRGLIYMTKMWKYILMLLSWNSIYGQFAPPVGQPGSTAIHKDSSIIVGWAKTCQIQRGYIDIKNPTQGSASVGQESFALGIADNSVVSLGDSGVAILTFDYPIFNGAGPDFAVFENSFNGTFLELAFVEVSSDGTHYVRFPAISLTDTATQVGTFGSLDATKIHNLAGKYAVYYGTPFDLEDLKDSTQIDLQNITHIKIIDVIGCMDPNYRTYDSQGHPVNDPYPTPFASAGFDLDAIGVIHWNTSTSKEKNTPPLQIYPTFWDNSVPRKLHVISHEIPLNLQILTLQGNVVIELKPHNNHSIIDLTPLSSGIFFVNVRLAEGYYSQKIFIQD